jgi:hypothetical protein
LHPDRLQSLVTDLRAPDDFVEALEKLKINVLIAPDSYEAVVISPRRKYSSR